MKRSAFTLIELIVVVAIIVILAAIIIPAVLRMVGGGNKANAEKQWTAYLSQRYPDYDVKFEACQSMDTDNNGYTSCSARLVPKPGTKYTADLNLDNWECATAYGNTGCRVKPGTFNTNQ